MPNTSTVYPSGNATVIAGTWTNGPTGLNADDATLANTTSATKNATATLESGTITIPSGDIPAGATINSVTVEYEDQGSVANGTQRITPYLGATAGSNTDHATSATLTARTVNITRPGGGSWTASDLTGGTLKIRVTAVQPNNTTSTNYRWDYVRVFATYTIPAVVKIKNWRFFADDNSAYASLTPLAAEKTNISVAEDAGRVILAYQFQESGGGNGQTGNPFGYHLQVVKNGGTSHNVDRIGGGSRADVGLATSPNFTDRQAITAGNLTGGSGTFVNGEIDENDAGAIEGVGVAPTANNYTESAWVMALLPADVSPGDVLQLRAYDSQNGVIGTLEAGVSWPEITVTAATATAYDTEIDTDSPTDHYKLGDIMEEAIDRVGGNHGVLSGTYTQERTSLLDFNNGSDRATRLNAGGTVTVPDSTSLRLNGSWTIEMWIKPVAIPASGTFPSLISKGDAHTSALGWNLWYDPSQSRRLFFLRDNVTITSPVGFAVPAAGTRAFLAVNYDGTNMHFYLDGVEVGTGVAASWVTGTGTGAMTLGKSADSGTNGDVDFDEVAIYNTALSASRILAHYNKGTTAGGTNHTVFPADTLSLADTILAAERGFQTTADSVVVVDDLVTKEANFATLPGDSLTLTDAQSFGYGEGVADAASVADAQTPASGKATTVPDTASVADSATPQAGKETSLADTLTVADAVALGFGEALADALGVADALALAQGETLADTLTLADSATAAAGFMASLASSVTLADLATTQSGKEANPSDTLTLADALGLGHGEGIADTAGVADSVSTASVVIAAVADTATVADALGIGYGEGIADALGLADLLAAARGYDLTLPDTLILADAQTLASGVSTTLADTLTLADAVATARAVATTIADTAGLADAQSFINGLSRTLADTATLADSVTPAAGTSLAIFDVLVLTDSASAAAGFSRDILDVLGLTDDVLAEVPLAQGAYIHHVPPLGGIYDYVGGGLVIAVVSDGTITVYDAAGAVVTVDAAGNVIPGPTSGVQAESVTSGTVVDAADDGVQV